MKSIKLLLLIVLALVIMTCQGNSQSEISYAKNCFHGTVSFLGLGAAAGLSYERHIWHNPDRAFLNSISARVAGGAWAVWDTEGKAGIAGLSGLTGKKKHKLETLLGVTVSKNNNQLISSLETLIATAIGYRFQKPHGGFVFRTGLGIPEGIYLGIGFAF